MPKNKMRLDRFLVEKGLVKSRQRAQALIMEGKVRVNGLEVAKAGISVYTDSKIEILGEPFPFVSRGGVKLAHAVKHFRIPVSRKVCLDVGASTGGFTDCLLQNGAKKVYSVDVGYGQLAWKLRTDPRVICLERQNVRHLTRKQIPEPIDLATIDVSFISLKLVVPVVRRFLADGGMLLALIKPQFEVGKGKVGKGGVVRDPGEHERVIEETSDFLIADGWKIKGVVESPLLGPKGNKEFFIYGIK